VRVSLRVCSLLGSGCGEIGSARFSATRSSDAPWGALDLEPSEPASTALRPVLAGAILLEAAVSGRRGASPGWRGLGFEL
jgi:hypothetical protein